MLKKIPSFLAVISLLCLSATAQAQNDPASTAVAATVEKLRVQMINPKEADLSALVADELSYGHSGGKVDTKSSFMADLLSGASDFVTLNLSEQTIRIVGDAAIVRHTLTAETNDSGKPGNVKLHVLSVWQKRGDAWKLLARQAVRI